jgi:hypothetical protein
LFKELEFRTLGVRVKAVIEGKEVQSQSASRRNKVESKKKSSETSEVEYDEEVPSKKKKEEHVSLPVPLAEFRPVAVGAWLLDSNYGNPTYEEVLEITNTKDWDDAKKAVVEEIPRRGLSRVYEEIELPLIPVLDAMKERGIKIDRKYMAGLAKEYHARISALEKGIYKLAGQEFNLNSPKQLGEILFDKLQLTAPRMKKTAGGARSTKESELLKLSEHAIVKKILDYRQLAKLVGTYIDAIPPLLDDNDRLHSTFDQTGAATGRMSSNLHTHVAQRTLCN